MNKILLLGGAGFIGQNLAKFLAKDSVNSLTIADNFFRNNGKIDTYLYDRDCNGKIDLVEYDDNEDGKIDYIGIDSDENGKNDIYLSFDKHKEGKHKGEYFARWSYDKDEDGYVFGDRTMIPRAWVKKIQKI